MERRLTRIGAIRIPSTRFFVQRGNTVYSLSFQSAPPLPSASAESTSQPIPREGSSSRLIEISQRLLTIAVLELEEARFIDGVIVERLEIVPSP